LLDFSNVKLLNITQQIAVILHICTYVFWWICDLLWVDLFW